MTSPRTGLYSREKHADHFAQNTELGQVEFGGVADGPQHAAAALHRQTLDQTRLHRPVHGVLFADRVTSVRAVAGQGSRSDKR